MGRRRANDGKESQDDPNELSAYSGPEAALVAAAKRDSRTVNSLIEKVLSDYVRSVGLDPDRMGPTKSKQ